MKLTHLMIATMSLTAFVGQAKADDAAASTAQPTENVHFNFLMAEKAFASAKLPGPELFSAGDWYNVVTISNPEQIELGNTVNAASDVYQSDGKFAQSGSNNMFMYKVSFSMTSDIFGNKVTTYESDTINADTMEVSSKGNPLVVVPNQNSVSFVIYGDTHASDETIDCRIIPSKSMLVCRNTFTGGSGDKGMTYPEGKTSIVDSYDVYVPKKLLHAPPAEQ